MASSRITPPTESGGITDDAPADYGISASARLEAMREHRDDDHVTSAIARVEAVRSVLPSGAEAVARGRRLLGRLYQVAVDADLLDRTGGLTPDSSLRSLDAIHLACAQSLGADLRAVVTYDRRMANAAAVLRLPVATPVRARRRRENRSSEASRRRGGAAAIRPFGS